MIDFMDGAEEFRKQPGEIAWGIFDQAGVDRIAHEYIDDPTLADEKWIYELYQEDLEAEIKYAKKAPVRRADTLEELAKQLTIEPSVLLDTIRRYNEFFTNGKDEDFGKDKEHLRPIGENGPYYAIYGQSFSDGAFGGMMVNPDCEAIREDGSVIPGLYGVGDATSAMHHRDLLAVISELTWGVASAYMSGFNAVEYINSKEGN